MADRAPSHPSLASTLGELRTSGWRSVPVKEEIRHNVLDRIVAVKPIVEGVLGYSQSVLPAL